MLHNPVKDFFIRAVMYAKQNRMSELNYLEAELIMAEEQLLNLQNKNIPPEYLASFENRINDLKTIIRNKKKEL